MQVATDETSQILEMVELMEIMRQQMIEYEMMLSEIRCIFQINCED